MQIKKQKAEANRANPEPNRQRARRWRKENPQRARENLNRHRRAETFKKWQKSYYRKNRKRIIQTNSARHFARLKTDPQYKLLVLLRTRVWQALRGYRKSAKTSLLLGAPLSEVRAHLASLFWPGMTWKNHGAWHVDHVRPCSKFDLSDPEQQRACFHYANLQPLWASDNLSKGARIL